MERLSSSVQSWVEEHKLASIGGLWATAVGASVAYGRRKTPQMRDSTPGFTRRPSPSPSSVEPPLRTTTTTHHPTPTTAAAWTTTSTRSSAGHHRRRPGEREVELVVLPFLPAARCRQMKMMTITMIN
uniref:Aie2 protein n=1 Tax=Oryza sativa TaxID=4530 RepID=O81091_ORYSA|nr:anaerobically inducible early gene 2 [Oryza sativa Indica Group]